MKKMNSENKLCLMCMEEHEVFEVQETEFIRFKGQDVTYNATYEYCDQTDELLETEALIRANKLAMIDAYRAQMNLLVSAELIAIRDKYGISQKDFSEVLDWGKATITRYENHQVQDSAHDDVLRMVANDPKWFIDKLEDARERISLKAHKKYLANAKKYLFSKRNSYLIESIQAEYAVHTNASLSGCITLDLAKVVEVINYLALKVDSLHKVKLMKMLWYADNLFYKRTGKSITGQVYKALPMGAVPEGHDKVISLEGVRFEENCYDGEHTAYKFMATEGFQIHYLAEDEISAIDTVIKELGSMNAATISSRMHEEEAYKCTASFKAISYEYAKDLSLN